MLRFKLEPAKFLRVSDGDTPVVEMGVRMLGIDTPELHFPGPADPSRQDGALAGLPKSAAFKALPRALREHLAPRLEGAGSWQARWGALAREALEAMVDESLARKGAGRDLSLACGGETFDRYGRILAFVAPHAPRDGGAAARRPDTFNLRLLAGGWAAPNFHAANLAGPEDMRRAVLAVQGAREGRQGFWAEAGSALHGYEFRALVRLASGQGGFSYKVTDLRDRLAGRVLTPFEPEAYTEIEEEYRVFE